MIRILGIAATAALISLLALDFTGGELGSPGAVDTTSESATALLGNSVRGTNPQQVIEFPTAPDRMTDTKPSPEPAEPHTKSERSEIPREPIRDQPTQSPADADASEADETPVTRPDINYAYPPLSFETINANAREALVNILCAPTSGALYPISASGIIIDERGTILTNAHVGQYFLLEADSRVDMRCTIRAGSPARARWRADLMYLPESWVAEHARDLTQQRPMGTGEHDWALLHINEALDGETLPEQFPHLDPETRRGALFEGDTVLLASYPAGFLGGIAAHGNLYPGSSITTVGQLFTFTDTPIDLVSLGGVFLAQGGSSGGAVANAWNKLVGIITTSSDGQSTAERDLRAITLEHVNRSMQAHTDMTLEAFLAVPPVERVRAFSAELGPRLSQALVSVLTQ